MTRQSLRTLILLDVDGVLVHPVGYKKALRDTVDHFTDQMGLTPLALTDDEIAIFEACGITNEWDSGAMCVSLLLADALSQRPELRGDTLEGTFAAIRSGRPGGYPRADIAGMARAVNERHVDGRVPAAVFLDMMRERVDPGVFSLLEPLLADVYRLDTPTTGVFQAHTLGEARFVETYDQQPPVVRDSYLLAYDIPLLSESNRDRVVSWHADPRGGATIFTARPSLPPPGLQVDGSCFAPEAELAATLLNLDGYVPLVGQGRMDWLARQHQRGVVDYVKPSPVQGLAAIGAAASGDEVAALEAAATLYERGMLSGPLAELGGGPVRVVVLEDSTGGIRATRRAVELLAGHGVDVSLMAIGVSPHQDKRAALASETVHVVDTVNDGLALVFDQ